MVRLRFALPVLVALLIGSIAAVNHTPAEPQTDDTITIRVRSVGPADVSFKGVVMSDGDSRRVSARTPFELTLVTRSAHAMFQAEGVGMLEGEIVRERDGKQVARAWGKATATMMLFMAGSGEGGYAGL